ncbi:hypothetical protein [Rhodococcus sp. 4CII]|uniref:hypothetical protein n=1 Tax=Rhodococcus sp. 4CII TaxID=2834580 RepID=UPI00163DD0BE|nr:hypothetical protein [Rhodococcus sp. 4CII]MBC2898377.1 hypothetical protein [Rhodococcus sp. 4CII]
MEPTPAPPRSSRSTSPTTCSDPEKRHAPFVAPDAVGVEPANLLQSAIDTYIPAGAEHCVTIRAAEPQRFLVTLRERQPSGEEVAYTQQAITTRVVDGRHVITSIGEAS